MNQPNHQSHDKKPGNGTQTPATGGTTGAASGPASSSAAAGAEATPKPKKERINKTFVVVGLVHEFETPLKAEQWLNGPDAPASGDYVVLKGQRVKSKNKVSLR